MSSLIGHVLGAEAALGFTAGLAPEAARTRRAMWVAGVVAVIPDLDVGLYLVAGKPDWGWLKPHAGLSHSLLFALALGLVGMLFLLKPRREGEEGVDSNLYVRALLVMSAVAGTHLLMDLFAPSNLGGGLPLLWPFSRRSVSAPVQLLPTAYYSTLGFRHLIHTMFLNWKSWVGMLIEGVILIPLLVMGWKKGLQRSAFWTLAAVSAVGMALTFCLYQLAKVL
jgi:membrane-bound metal-dependent hydrolase YbcI (DUF457 family)